MRTNQRHTTSSRAIVALVVIGLALSSSCASSSTTEVAGDSTRTDDLRLSFDVHGEGDDCTWVGVTFGPEGDAHHVTFPHDLSCGSDAALLIRDFNFDGRVDLGVLNEQPISNGPLYHYWLGQPSGTYDPSLVLNDAGLVSPEVDSGTHTIRSTSKAGFAHYQIEDYVWEGELLRRTSCTVEEISDAGAVIGHSACEP